MRPKLDDIALAEGNNELNVQMVPVAVELDYPQLTILDVEGIPFTRITTEPMCTLVDYIAHLALYADPSQPYIYISDLEALVNCVASVVDPCTASEGEIFSTLLGPCKEYLVLNPGATWEATASLLTGSWVVKRPTGDITAVYLAEPIAMSRMRGVKIHYLNKTLAPKDPRFEEDPAIIWILFYQPQFIPPDLIYGFAPPGFRAIDYLRISPGEEGEATPSVFAGGYYYPGTYDGFIYADYTGWYPYWSQRPIGTFRIKNLARVTGSGVLQPPGY